MKMIKSIVLLGIALISTPLIFNAVFAQESDAKLIDEVIARVNSGVIMRSTYAQTRRVGKADS
jgi:hypothetical protein